MTIRLKTSITGNERLGLIMIGAALLVIAVVTALMFRYQQMAHVTQLRSQGISLVRLFSAIPYDRLATTTGQLGPLQIMKETQTNPEFAYAAVVDAGGRTAVEVTAPGVLVPPASPPSSRTGLIGERSVRLAGGNDPVLEFFAPVWAEGGMAGHVRLGYREPGWEVRLGELPLFATVALLVFLLAPLFYVLVRREVRPLVRANAELEQRLEEGRFQRVQVDGTGEFADFLQRFNRFMGMADDRIGELEQQRTKLETSRKMLTYRRERTETILQALPEMVLVMDEAGTPSFANGKMLALLGKTEDEVIGLPPSSWCDEPEVLAYVSRWGGGGGSAHMAPLTEFKPASAPEKTVSMRAAPMFAEGEHDAPPGTLLVFRDVTTDKHSRESQAEFVAHVAHELKTPLNVLSMYSESLLGEDGEDPEFRIEACNVIHDEVERLSGLINNLLSITKIEMGTMTLQRQRTKLGDLLGDAFETVARSGRDKGLTFDLDVPSDIPAVSVDKELLRVALNNLLTNAIKYNREGGTVTLSAEETDEAIRIRIRDTGVGIAPEDRIKIFEKFYRSDAQEVRDRPGHGLGLALAHQIVLMHHGTIDVESEPGEGAEFIVAFAKDAGLVQQALRG